MSRTKTFARGVGAQTDYREESTQTQPFSPPYTSCPGEHPEVFSSTERSRRWHIREEEIQTGAIPLWLLRNNSITSLVLLQRLSSFRLQLAREKQFSKDLHTYVDLDEDLSRQISELTAYRAGKQLAIHQQRLELDAERDRRRLEKIFRLRTRRINASSRVIGRVPFTVKVPLRIRDLNRAQQFIDDERNKSNVRRPCRFLERIESIESKEISQLPARLTSEVDEDRRRRANLIELQNYLRGIVVQSRLDHVRRIRGDLLDELRRETTEDDERTPVSPTAELDWSTVAEMLDFLSKELIRLQCEQSIGLFISQADGHRSERERIETARRRSTAELSFPLPELDGFLADLVRQSIFDTADEQARDELRETSVSELVHHFLIPLVHRLVTTK